MATLATETWTGTTGAAWPTQWVTGSTQGTATIQTNRGRLLADGNGYRRVNRYLNIANATTSEIYVEVTIAALTEQYVYVFLRSTIGDNPYPLGYGVMLTPNLTTYTMELGYGTGESLQTTAPLTYTVGATYGIRLRVEGYTFKSRVWNLTGAEPTSWALTSTDPDSSFPTGKAWLGYMSGNAANGGTSFDNLTLTDAASAVTGTLTLSGSGTVAGAGSPKLSAARAYTGVGALTTAGQPQTSSSTALNGAGSLNLAGNSNPFGAATLTGSGTLTSSGQPTAAGASATSSTGTLTLTGQPTVASNLELTNTSTLNPTATPAVAGTVQLGADGSTAASGQPRIVGDTASLGAGSLAATGYAATSARIDLTGAGALTYATNGSASGTLNLGSAWQLTVAGTIAIAGGLNLVGLGTVVGAGSARTTGQLNTNSTGTLALLHKQTDAAHEYTGRITRAQLHAAMTGTNHTAGITRTRWEGQVTNA